MQALGSHCCPLLDGAWQFPSWGNHETNPLPSRCAPRLCARQGFSSSTLSRRSFHPADVTDLLVSSCLSAVKVGFCLFPLTPLVSFKEGSEGEAWTSVPADHRPCFPVCPPRLLELTAQLSFQAQTADSPLGGPAPG